MYMTLIVAFSDSFMDSLSEEQRNVVADAVTDTIEWHRENNQTLVAEDLKSMEKNGNIISKLADGELDKIRKACAPVYQYALDTHGDIVTRLSEAVEALK